MKPTTTPLMTPIAIANSKPTTTTTTTTTMPHACVVVVRPLGAARVIWSLRGAAMSRRTDDEPGVVCQNTHRHRNNISVRAYTILMS